MLEAENGREDEKNMLPISQEKKQAENGNLDIALRFASDLMQPVNFRPGGRTRRLGYAGGGSPGKPCTYAGDNRGRQRATDTGRSD